MINENDVDKNKALIRHEYDHCKLCDGIVHKLEAKCGGCAAKKANKIEGVDLLCFFTHFLLLYITFFLGKWCDSYLYIIPVTAVISCLMSLRYKKRWLIYRMY